MSTSYPIEIDCLEIDVSEGRCHNSQPPRITLISSRSTMTYPNIIQYNTDIFLLKILSSLPFLVYHVTLKDCTNNPKLLPKAKLLVMKVFSSAVYH